jgi:hypothetical protein
VPNWYVWLAVHDARNPLICLVASAPVYALVAGRTVQPPVDAIQAPVQVRLVIPLLTAVLVAMCLRNGNARMDAVSSRSVAGVRAIWFGAVMLLGVLSVAALLLTNLPGEAALAAARNVCALSALAAATAVVVGTSLAWLAPSVYLLLCVFFGQSQDGTGSVVTKPWAWLMAEEASTGGLVAVALAAVAAGLYAVQGAARS